VVGCCLLDVESVRPATLPARLGTRLRAAAHRVSVEWEDDVGETIVGVYVPVRLTNSRAARVLGGRWFPGVHRSASIALVDESPHLHWSIEPTDRATGYRVDVRATITSSSQCDPIGATCLRATVGLSPDHHGALEAALMQPEHRRPLRVEIDHLDSEFIAGFRTARPAPSYLMSDVHVTWTKVQQPRVALDEARA
jgi:hypothetical protein